jgi:hypothetical protein
MVRSALQGLNSTIMAYGQTGSGKTFTMEGSDGDLGCAPRAVTQVFCDLAVAVERGDVLRFDARASFLQVAALYWHTLRRLVQHAWADLVQHPYAAMLASS